MLICDNCGNDFEEGICSDCELDLRAAAERTPVELAAGELLNALKDLQKAIREYGLLDIKKRFSLCVADAQANTTIAKVQGNPSPQPNPLVQDEHKSAP